VIQEQTKELGDQVLFEAPVPPGANILRRGEDARKGAVLLRPGRRIGAAETGILAAVGKAAVRIHRQPRIRILCTGSELRELTSRPRPYEIRNSVGPALAAALAGWGFSRPRYGTVPDDPPAVLRAIRRALRAGDAVLMTGGVSVGRYDFVPEAIRSAGASIRFHGVAMKPGKPTLFATTPDRKLIFGLPGNPLSALNAFHEFVLPALRRLCGLPPADCRVAFPVLLAAGIQRKPGRLRYHLARLEVAPEGWRASPVKSMSSADLASAAGADGVILVPPGHDSLPPGAIVAFRPWRPLP
jgi:molybdopterin molybdotransferase